MLKDQKLRVCEDKIIMLDTSMMTLEDATYYDKESRNQTKDLEHSSSTQ